MTVEFLSDQLDGVGLKIIDKRSENVITRFCDIGAVILSQGNSIANSGLLGGKVQT